MGQASAPDGFHYEFHGDPNEMFSRFFKDSFQRSSSFGETPFEDSGSFFFANNLGMGGRQQMGASGMGMDGMGIPQQEAQPVVFDLNCSLEELYAGTTKKMKVKRKSSTLKRDAEAILEVNVKPGWKAGTKITFGGEGDEVSGAQAYTPHWKRQRTSEGGKAQDVVFVVREKKHKTFTREGSNLLYNVKIPLVDALTGCHVDIATLDNRILRVNVRDMVTPTYTKVVKGEGMPQTKDGGKGDLIITFDIVYPTSLGEEQKDGLRKILPKS